mgnify:CR=1 FL=1
MIFLCYPKCSTCQKAQKWLDANGASYELRNIKDDKPTEAELRAWHNLSGLPLKKFFNTSGLLYKSMALKDPSKNIILSPPQKKRPKTSIKGKSIVVTFEEPLDSNTTYSLNFGNAIVDNNESNPLPFFTYTFSTGTTIDTCRLKELQ